MNGRRPIILAADIFSFGSGLRSDSTVGVLPMKNVLPLVVTVAVSVRAIQPWRAW